jgi:dodecin
MGDEPVYKLIELTGTSSTSLEDAIQNAIAKAARTVRLMRWFQVTEIRGAVDGTAVSAWQVTLKIGFTVED